MAEATIARRWTTEQFDSMSWHDNHVYALRLEEGEWGSGRLTLDIDYIMEWVKIESKVNFRVIPARLIFLEVSELRMNLDYSAASAAHGPFSIHAITHRSEDRQRYVAQIWNIAINWPKGEFEFMASGFEQIARGNPILCDEQRLGRDQRMEILI